MRDNFLKRRMGMIQFDNFKNIEKNAKVGFQLTKQKVSYWSFLKRKTPRLRALYKKLKVGYKI
jgi:hypothetical protein